jgi:hypothetical protein
MTNDEYDDYDGAIPDVDEGVPGGEGMSDWATFQERAMTEWIFSPPIILQSDNGPEFLGAEETIHDRCIVFSDQVSRVLSSSYACLAHLCVCT